MISLNPPRLLVFESQLGWMSMLTTGSQILEFSFGRSSLVDAVQAFGSRSDVVDPNRAEQKWIRGLLKFAQGKRVDFSEFPLATEDSTPFQQRVLTSCRRIPYGETLSYGQLAGQAGSPRAARAVGNIMSNNRFPIMIPCHRVIGSGKCLGGFSAPNGLTMKKRLLRMEGSLDSLLA